MSHIESKIETLTLMSAHMSVSNYRSRSHERERKLSAHERERELYTPILEYTVARYVKLSSTDFKSHVKIPTRSRIVAF